MLKIGIIRESKVPADSRVAFSPKQCKWMMKHFTNVEVHVQSSRDRCFSDNEYQEEGIEVRDEVDHCDILFGIKEVPVHMLIPGKTYLFFSHTRKKQPINQQLFRAIIEKDISLIDYECFQYENKQRILGFGFYAGVVGAHNGLMAYGKRTGAFSLGRAYLQPGFNELITMYDELTLPDIKIALTGSGRVATGVLELMKILQVKQVQPAEYLTTRFRGPVFTQLKAGHLYLHQKGAAYERQHFFENAADYSCLFYPYTKVTDILINGIYWDEKIPRLFECEDLRKKDFHITTIADITDDNEGSVPCNLGDSTIVDPVYGVDKNTFKKTAPYIPGSVDMMAVGNLPNELPREASEHFGSQLLKHVFNDLVSGGSPIIERATMVSRGQITPPYEYLRDYAEETLVAEERA